jgi:hypothetical protein
MPLSTDQDQVVTALGEQLGCYRRLAKLAEMQHEHVQQGQTDQLLDVLVRRQEVLDRIAALEKYVAPARHRWREFVETLPADERGQAESSLSQARDLLEQITAADRNDALVLQQRKINLGRQISQAATARQVNRTYAAAAYGKPPARMDVQR